MAATKWTSFNAEPNEHSSDRIQLLDLQSSPMEDPEAKQTYEDDNGRLGRQQPAENIVIGRRMLPALIAVLVLSILAMVVTLTLTVTMLSKNVPYSMKDVYGTKGAGKTNNY